jgi:Flp pilus assembly protein TadD
VFLAKLEAPYIAKSEQPGSPTLDDPIDEYTTTLTVNAKPEKLVVIDAMGKEVWSCVVGTADTLRTQSSARNESVAKMLSAALGRVAANPRDASALVDAGNAALAMDDTDAATGFFSRAEQIAPGDPRAMAGQAAAYVRRGDPYTAIRLFDEAARGGTLSSASMADRGLAYDLVGDNATAQRHYREAGSGNDEALRRLAISLAILGDKRGFEAALTPLMARQDKSAWRARAFSLAILGDEAQAVQIANATMSTASSSGIAPYLRYMRQLTHAQQAATAILGRFPRASEIGRDDPRIAQYQSSGIAGLVGVPTRPAAGNADIAAPLRAAQAARPTPIESGDEQFRILFDSW